MVASVRAPPLGGKCYKNRIDDAICFRARVCILKLKQSVKGVHKLKVGGLRAVLGRVLSNSRTVADAALAARRNRAANGRQPLFWTALLCCLIIVQSSSQAAQTPASEVTSIAVAGSQNETTFDLVLSRGVPAEIFTLAEPYRVIIDLPDVAFKLPSTKNRKGQGLVTEYRYGLFAEGKGRVVIDTSGPVKIAKAGMTAVDKGIALQLVLSPTDAQSFGSGTGATRNPPIETAATTPPKEKLPQKKRGKPVVVIDPGHGGIDPGAISPSSITEKSIVLAVAQSLRDALAKTGLYDVKMTRTTDVFVSLDKRLKFSADNDADLFISLHADAIEQLEMAENVSGATIYTLSERASDEQARIMAEKENASDMLAGLESGSGTPTDQVKNILIDLLKRETSNFSADFSNVLAGRLGKTIAMSRDPQRSAAFKVLKQPDAPSVLVELGYMSNSKDQLQMTTAAWQKQVANAITAAVQTYFSKRTAAQP